MARGQADLDQLNLTEQYLQNYEALNEYVYPNLMTAHFTYMKKRDPKNSSKFLDDGVCSVCGKKNQYVLILPKVPKMCFKCYQTVRAYKSLFIDTLGLKKKKELTSKDCQKILKYMKVYAKTKLLALAALSAALTTPIKKK